MLVNAWADLLESKHATLQKFHHVATEFSSKADFSIY